MKDKTIEELIDVINQKLGSSKLKLRIYKEKDTLYWNLYEKDKSGEQTNLLNEWDAALVQSYLMGFYAGLYR